MTELHLRDQAIFVDETSSRTKRHLAEKNCKLDIFCKPEKMLQQFLGFESKRLY